MPLPIRTVLQKMTFDDFVRIAERAERERQANERLRLIELYTAQAKAKRAAEERQQIVALGRPEYQFLKNAQAKEKRYQRRIRRSRREREILLRRVAVETEAA